MIGRVLVVEDNRDEADIICELLQGLGETPVWVRSDEEAYRAFSAPEYITGLVVDVHLGLGTTGFDVARFARQAKPSLPVVYVSGQVSPASFRAFGVPDSAYLEKPFSTDGFNKAFERAFRSPPEGALPAGRDPDA
jgi:CheY-like chemotaxis protein